MNNNELLDNFRELNKQIEAAKKEMRDKSQGLVEALVKQFLDACPEVTGIHWSQYTPYFNDGDSCEFSVNEICFHILNEDEDEDDIEAYDSTPIYTQADLDKAIEKLAIAESYQKDPEAYRQSYLKEYRKRWNREYSGNTSHNKQYPSNTSDAQERIDEIKERMEEIPVDVAARIDENFKAFKEAMSIISDDIMETLYGDHVMVIINRDGTHIDEYQHD